jgi:hypothetical protein
MKDERATPILCELLLRFPAKSRVAAIFSSGFSAESQLK